MRYPRWHRSSGQTIARLGPQSVLPPALQGLLALWRRKCAGRPLPETGDIPDTEYQPWEHCLAVIDRTEPERLLIRSCGLGLIRRYGRFAAGVPVDDLALDIARQLRAAVSAAADAAAPVSATSQVRLGTALSIYSEVVLPLGAGGRVAAVLLGSCLIRES